MTGKFVKVAVLLGVLTVISLRAQVSTSSITGVVTDSSGAVVANAKVEAKNDDTGVAFNVLNHANWENPRNATAGSPSVRSSIFWRTCCVTASLPSSATVFAIGDPSVFCSWGSSSCSC